MEGQGACIRTVYRHGLVASSTGIGVNVKVTRGMQGESWTVGGFGLNGEGEGESCLIMRGNAERRGLVGLGVTGSTVVGWTVVLPSSISSPAGVERSSAIKEGSVPSSTGHRVPFSVRFCAIYRLPPDGVTRWNRKSCELGPQLRTMRHWWSSAPGIRIEGSGGPHELDDGSGSTMVPRMVSVKAGVSSVANLGRCGTRFTLTVNGLLTLGVHGGAEADGKSAEGIV